MKIKTQLIISIVSVFIFSTEISLAQVNLDSGLVAHYPFNGNANDESGNGYSGTVLGAGITSDQFGNQNSAYLFDGINDYMVTSNSVENNFDIPNNISIAVWVRLDNANDFLQAAVSKAELAGYEIGYYGNTNKKYFINFYVGGSYRTCLSQSFAKESEWVHLVGIYEHTPGSSGIVKFYVDGILEDENIIGADYGITNSNVPFVIGANPNNSNPTINKFWDGALDEVYVYNRVLNQSEIDTLSASNPTNIVSINNEINIYPNPTTNYLSVELDKKNTDFDIEILDLNGRAITSESVKTNQKIVDVSNFDKGVYFIRIQTEDFIKTTKIIKK